MALIKKGDPEFEREVRYLCNVHFWDEDFHCSPYYGA